MDTSNLKLPGSNPYRMSDTLELYDCENPTPQDILTEEKVRRIAISSYESGFAYDYVEFDVVLEMDVNTDFHHWAVSLEEAECAVMEGVGHKIHAPMDKLEIKPNSFIYPSRICEYVNCAALSAKHV